MKTHATQPTLTSVPAERIEHTQRVGYPHTNYIIVLWVLRNHYLILLPKGPLYRACETADSAKRIRSGDKTSRSHNDDHNEECTRMKSTLTRLGNTLLNRDQRRRQKTYARIRPAGYTSPISPLPSMPPQAPVRNAPPCTHGSRYFLCHRTPRRQSNPPKAAIGRMYRVLPIPFTTLQS